MAEWQQASLSADWLEPITAALEGLEAASDTLATIYTALATISKIVAALQGSIDLEAELIDQAFEVLITALNELAADSAGHLLFVPPIAPFDREPRPPRIPIQALENIIYARMVNYTTAGLVADGGNYGVYRRFVESLFDRGDFAKPAYSTSAYVGGGILFFGADSFASILQGMLSLSALFSGALALPTDNYQLPVPANIKARAVATPERSALNGFQVVDVALRGGTPRDTEGFLPLLSRPQLPEFVSVKVFWDPPKTVQFTVSYGPQIIAVKRWHVFVKPDERIRAGEDLSQYELATYTLFEDDTPASVKAGVGENPVLGSVNGVILRKARPETTYYISAAYTIEMTDPTTGSSVEIGPSWETLSGQVRFRGEDQLPYSQFTESIPPDWLAISSPVHLFPPARQALREVAATVELYRSVFADRADAIGSGADFILEIINTLQSTTVDINALIGDFLRTLEDVSIGIWSTTFFAQGGNPALVNAVGELLLDPQVPNRPPFDQGDEAVSAIFLVAGSETAAEVEAFIALLQLFLGGGDGFTVLSELQQSQAAVHTSYLTPGADPTMEANAANVESPAPATVHELGISDDDEC